MDNFGQLDTRLRIPDIWQQEAVALLLGGKDVVLHAPTGAGKTFLVELLAAKNKHGQIVHTVPTRALANDKASEWRDKGWRVGLVTGDVSIDPEAPLVVATLETQKSRFRQGEGPSIFVVDEYQMLGDDNRGVNYELAIATAPPSTQLLLLSGSVSNPEDVVSWLNRIGRSAELVSIERRPVPLDEVYLDSLPGNLPRSLKGFWPRLVAKALMADLGPILVFSPQRKGAERLARQLAGAIPVMDPLGLSSQQKKLSGSELARLLKNRVAYHHSGLSYQQRAGLVEPLAKAGQLRIVVSTTGLAAGVNFSMRSVIVTENSFTADYAQKEIRPDELLQMFGRAGRRGLDERGYALVAPDKPRLSEGRPLPVKRPGLLDWPNLIRAMDVALPDDSSRFSVAVKLVERLFQSEKMKVGVERSLEFPDAPCGLGVDADRARYAQCIHEEILNTSNEWQKAPTKSLVPLRNVRIRVGDSLGPFLEVGSAVAELKKGSLYRLKKGGGRVFGKRVTVGFRDKKQPGLWSLASWFRSRLSASLQGSLARRVDLEYLESLDKNTLSKVVGFGEVVAWRSNARRISLIVDMSSVEIEAACDVDGFGIVDPETRKSYAAECSACPMHPECEHTLSPRLSPAKAWSQLGLVSAQGVPTRRGRLFSFFQNGEGLAIAAALEEKTYSVDSIAQDLANLRAGFRFDDSGSYSHRLARACRIAYQDWSYDGYLKHGLPPQYGEGAAEVIAAFYVEKGKGRSLINDVLKPGDVQRVRLEWLSLLRQIRSAPDLKWQRWLELKGAVVAILESEEQAVDPRDLLELEPMQRHRVSHLLRFPRGF